MEDQEGEEEREVVAEAGVLRIGVVLSSIRQYDSGER